jgi:hypothetical protein
LEAAHCQKVAIFERNFFNNPLYKIPEYWRIARMTLQSDNKMLVEPLKGRPARSIRSREGAAGAAGAAGEWIPMGPHARKTKSRVPA